MDSLPLSPAAQALMSRATEESTRLGHRFLGVEHLFVALSTSGNTSLRRAFASHNIGLDDFVAGLFDGSEALEHTPWGSEVLVTPRCQEVLHLATRIATRARKSLVTDEHILQSIFEEGRSVPMRLLRSRRCRSRSSTNPFFPSLRSLLPNSRCSSGSDGISRPWRAKAR